MTTAAPQPKAPADVLTGADRAMLDQALEELGHGAAAWARMGADERSQVLRQTHATIRDSAEQWAEAASAAKGTPVALAGEEWMSGPYVALTTVAALADSLDAIAQGRSTVDGLTTGTAPGGRTTIKVLPTELKETVLLHGFSAEIWTAPGVTAEQVRQRAGLGAARTGENGGVGLVLGAGNITAIGPADVLYELVAHNRASILKLNPTFATLLPVLLQAFAPLVEAGVLRIVNGAAAVGGYLARHPSVSHVHITGSGLTHDAIVWGTGSASTKRRATGTPLLGKPISSELGGVSPIIVVPGKWSQADLRYQAEHVATQRLHNAGHNCIAGQALILSADWDQRDEFLDQLRRVLDEIPPRPPWYPGSDRKTAAAEASYPSAEQRTGRLLIEVTDSTSQDLLTTEYFAPVLGHTSLPGLDGDFLTNAVAFANDRLEGSLGASIIIDPRDRKELGAKFDEAIADLRYGAIGINVWSAIAFLIPGLPWGAYPGNTLEQVGSGIGIVHNAHLIDAPERAVVAGPFRPSPRSLLHGELALSPKPAWFVTARASTATSKKLTSFAADPAWRRLPGIIASASRG
ncbi:aldehyde dehydrogenase family protein [Nocardioides sp.]|uniref:aldehyde dehydrogenase family protein n=1 Tax=Nocardioides sp. TaxID=35761 RepID=UPI002BC82128|nr:aldehyde dehydrogenase family protein [Nocardioides sp.]HSX65914.1 aldehyde dehydrogenase family protein [Nocardioides sp.]